MRVEWFRTWECSRRWQEKVQWLQREAATVVVDFDARSAGWRLRAEEGSLGALAYTYKQSTMWKALSLSARTTLVLPLQVRHLKTILIRLTLPSGRKRPLPIGCTRASNVDTSISSQNLMCLFPFSVSKLTVPPMAKLYMLPVYCAFNHVA